LIASMCANISKSFIVSSVARAPDFGGKPLRGSAQPLNGLTFTGMADWCGM
jgi:hypothetical protein